VEGLQVRRAPYSLAAALLALAACGPQDPKVPRHRLEGSLGQVLDLGYDEVRVQLAPEDVSVLFVRVRASDGTADAGASTSEDYPFKVAVDLLGAPPFGAVRVDLAEQDEAGVQRGVFSRNVLGDPRREFPAAVRSTLYFDRVPVEGGVVKGDFHVTFEDGIEAASGRTVFGSFDAKVVQ
jgi:hypothetical protein